MVFLMNYIENTTYRLRSHSVNPRLFDPRKHFQNPSIPWNYSRFSIEKLLLCKDLHIVISFMDDIRLLVQKYPGPYPEYPPIY